MLHYFRLLYRSVLLILLLIGYIRFRIQNGVELLNNLEKRSVLLVVVWAVFVFEMILRFFPSRY